MSISRNIYLGPWIKILNGEYYEPKKTFGCVNPDCSEVHSNIFEKFCSSCGNTLEEFQIQVKKYFNIHDFCEKVYKDCDRFSDVADGADYYVISNRREQAGDWINEEITIDSKDFDLEHNQFWKELAEYLKDAVVEFELGSGLISYYD
jgi:hypothetical protein